jgi:Uma2 family endonuclease
VVVAPAEVDAFYYSESYQLAAEVLSPSNSRLEVNLKTRLYCEVPSNLYAVVIDPTKFMVEIYAKSRKWEPVVIEHADDVIDIPEFGLRCLVADLYLGTPAARSRRNS